MKILFCTNAFENITNGPAKFANLILEINGLGAGHQVRVLTEDVAPERLPALRYVYRVQLRIPTVLKPLGQVLRMFQYYRRVKQIAREYPFDVLVYNNAFTGLYAALRAEWPTVGMINDDNNLAATLANFRLGRLWTETLFFQKTGKRGGPAAPLHHYQFRLPDRAGAAGLPGAARQHPQTLQGGRPHRDPVRAGASLRPAGPHPVRENGLCPGWPWACWPGPWNNCPALLSCSR
jgi:hypothetical protein